MSGGQQELVFELAVEVLDSFEKLEVLVRIAASASPVPGEALASSLALDRDEVAAALAQLVAADVIGSAAAGYSLVANGPWSRHVAALTTLYATDRMEVVTLMSKASLQRLRAQAARAFADAFVIRPTKKKGNDDDR